ncbi:hypothetical protein [Streptomyces sp. NPDC098781]|uniref:hypothetical protein n=1 Tax=Streptomyces sp. NPDC098781 TaxID=3366097 RepID=UPI00382146C8
MTSTAQGDIHPSEVTDIEPTETADTESKDPAGAPVTGRKSGSAGALILANDSKLGPVVTDSNGFALYRFTKDAATLPEKSACVGDCVKVWPPVPAEGASLPKGLDPKLLGSLTRSDGFKQLTVVGIPVYRYSKDTEPGTAKGEGVGGTWFASLPTEGIPALKDALKDITSP